MSKPKEVKSEIMDYGYYQECKRNLVIKRAELFNFL